jgi:HEPN domain-containing protein
MKALDPNVEGWLTKAEEDLKVARLVLHVAPPFPAAACYHAQQCAEKSLKGFLVAHRVPFKHVHGLAYLVKLCMDVEPGFDTLLTSAAELQDYASDVRYPSLAVEAPTPEEAGEAIERAEQIKEFVGQALAER